MCGDYDETIEMVDERNSTMFFIDDQLTLSVCGGRIMTPGCQLLVNQ